MNEGRPELGVVCRNCSSEVSAYVTECPYCGQRLRKSAPKLERRGEGLAPKLSWRQRRRSRRRPRERSFDLTRPNASIALLVVPAVLLVVMRAGDFDMHEVGALIGPVDSEWWRYLTASFAYDDIGYLFAVGLAIAITGPALEARLGTVMTLVLAIAGGGLAISAAAGVAELGLDDPAIAAGGNGIALCLTGALIAMRQAEAIGDPDQDWDRIGFIVIVLVLLALPIVEDWANPAAGIAAGAAGYLAGRLATLGRSS